MELTRRGLLRAAGLAGLASALPACSTDAGPLRIAAGSEAGTYYPQGQVLADEWRERLDLGQRPEVQVTEGSADNLDRLAAGTADVAFCQLDVAADRWADPAAPLSALARIYDDTVQLVVPRASPARTLEDLRRMRVSIGRDRSGVQVIALKLLAAARMTPEDVIAERLGLDDSVARLRLGELDAFFWVGGVPSGPVAGLAMDPGIRLIDLADLLPLVRTGSAPIYYTVGTVADPTYGLDRPARTLLVRNVLLVRDAMDPERAEALVEGLFAAQPRLAERNAVARAIDTRFAIGTVPVPLHPGVLPFYRSRKRA